MAVKKRGRFTKVKSNIGPKRKGTLFVVRNRSTGKLRQSSFDKGFNAKEEIPLVPEAFQYRSVGQYYDISQGASRKLSQELSRLVRHVTKQGGAIVQTALKPTFDLSQRYVPVDTGDLKASGKLEVKVGQATTSVEITYAGNGRPFYGVFVHEILDYAHLSPTRAKFLEVAIRQDMPNIKDRITRATQTVLGVQGKGRR